MSGKKTIVTLLRVSLLACPLLFTTPSFAMIDTPSVKVGFSPEGSASALVLDTINSAESSIRMMAYSFTDPDVMHALAKAKKRGVDVRIVVDDKGNTNRASQEAMKYINLLDIPLRTVDAFPIHHDKVIIVDGNTVETGSYNFSRAAARKNSENVVVLKNMPDVAAQYLEHWQDRWNKGTDWRPCQTFLPRFSIPPATPGFRRWFFSVFFQEKHSCRLYPATAPGLPCLQMK